MSVEIDTCKNEDSALLHFLIISPDPFFKFISGALLCSHKNTSMVLDRIIEQINVECNMQEWQLCFYFLIMFLDPCFHFISDLYLSNYSKYCNDNL